MKRLLERALPMIAVLAVTLHAATLMGQTKRPMTLVDLLEVPTLADPQLSPDGNEIAYVLSVADWEKGKRVSHIWRIRADGSGLVQLTAGDEGEESPRWSPDGRWIGFIARRGEDEHEQIYLISNEGGEAVRLTDHATAVSNLSWSPDGTFLYFLYFLASDPKTEEEKAREKRKDDVYAFESVELYTALKSNGVPTRLLMAPREPHGWRELRHQLFKMNAELEWFERHAMERDYTWEKAPEKATP